MAKRRRYTDDELIRIYYRADGYCHLCHKKLSFINYGANGRRGAWEVDHSVSIKRGGSSKLQNLYPACINCNRSKQAGSRVASGQVV